MNRLMHKSHIVDISVCFSLHELLNPFWILNYGDIALNNSPWLQQHNCTRCISLCCSTHCPTHGVWLTWFFQCNQSLFLFRNLFLLGHQDHLSQHPSFRFSQTPNNDCGVFHTLVLLQSNCKTIGHILWLQILWRSLHRWNFCSTFFMLTLCLLMLIQ